MLKPYVLDLIDLLMGLVRIENEDNAVLCMKTIMDLQRSQTEATVSRVQPFLSLIQEMFDGTSQAVKDTFDVPAQTNAAGSTPSSSSNFQSPRPSSPSASGTLDLSIDQQAARPLPRGMHSFKVLSECPIIVVSLFQAHKNIAPLNARNFIPRIKTVLMAQAQPQKLAHEDAKNKGTIFFGVCREIKNRQAFGDFVTAQVKTMSFLAYLLRAYTKQLDDFLPKLPDICIRMLRDCPSEKSATRKELLVAIRHIINFNFRGVFSKKVDELLDEQTLIGDGLTVYETMRPLAYSMLADLIHHVRDKLFPAQIQRTIELFSKNMVEDFPGTSFQTMSAKLLLGMADSISQLEDKEDGRHFLIMILRAIGDKFALMNKEYHNAAKLSKLYEPQSVSVSAEDHLADKSKPPDWDETDIFFATPIKTSIPRDPTINPVEDNKFLFRNLMMGLKNMFYRLKFTNPEVPNISEGSAPSNWKDCSYGFKAEDIQVIIRLVHEGARVFRYYSLEQPPNDTQYASPVEYWANLYMVQSSKEERELLETFATVFHCVDPAAFYEVFQATIPLLYEAMFEHTALLHIPQFLLASEATSQSFASMLLQFLMDKLEDVGSSDIKKSSILLRMFKLSFMAVTLFSQHNEQVLLPHVTKLVTRSIQLSTTANEPLNYFYLLRSLFRSIGGGRFELLYKEILPLLEMLLEVLNNLLNAARKPQERHLYVELCLTVPARLSNLLPHLSYLMRPLVVALRADSDLVGQGLRTLELCVDNLTADYLDPIMAPVVDDLMQALWDHLRPSPYSHFHSHTTLRILGKLGGRNRKFLTEPPRLSFRSYVDDESSFDLRLIGSTKDRAFPSRIGVNLAISKLSDVPKTAAAKKVDAYYKQQSLRLITNQIKIYLGFDSLPEDFARAVRLQADDLVAGNYSATLDVMDRSDKEKSIPKKEAQEETLKKLLKATMVAMTIEDLKATASSLLMEISRHFAILDLGIALANQKHRRKPFDPKSGEGPLCIDVKVLADSIAETLSSENPELREAAAEVIQYVYEAATTIFGTSEQAGRLPFFNQLAKAFSHNCYEEEWFTKAGGAFGLDVFVGKIDLGDAWMMERQTDFVRALIFLIKDIPQDLPIRTRVQAAKTLEAILRKCNSQAQKKDLENHQSKLCQLCLYVGLELCHMNKHAREAAQRSLAVIAECLHVEVYELIEPLKDRLLQPIYNKPLRALVFGVQIGFIEAITYCLRLQHRIVDYNEQLNRLVVEALALTDADDETLATKPTEYRSAESIVSLRVACIKLLSTTLSIPDLATQQQPQHKNRIISVFFKSLYSPSTEVIDAAYEGLRGVLSQTNKLQKDLLQNGLRPILMTLQDHKKISVQTLDGLARLLRLLTNYFKVEIGDRLINHMEIISNDPSIQKISFSLVEQASQIKIVTATLRIFHLLPPGAISMMPKLISKVLDFETKLRRTRNSPLRDPLISYLARYPKETWDYFYTRLGDMQHGRFFAQILTHSNCDGIREIVVANAEKLEKSCFPLDEKRKDVAIINGINIVHSLCSVKVDWIVSRESLRTGMLDAAKSLHASQKRNDMEAELRLPAYSASEQVMDIMVMYLKASPADLDSLFQLVEKTTTDQLRAQPVLKSFIYSHVISSESTNYWRSIVFRCIDLYNTRGSSQKTRTFVFKNFVNPILAMDVMRGYRQQDGEASTTRLLDKSLLDAIHNKLWRPQLGDISEENGQPGVDHSRLELLQMSAFLLKYHQGLVAEARKDIIKFGWSYIRLEDTINKHAAYVLIAFFIAQFDSPSKIVNQVYVALLRAHQNEGRNLVNQALDLIAPVLPKRMPGSGDAKFPMWAKWPKRIISEESSNLQQLICILNFMIRHPNLFYDSREHFIPLIIPSLPKIAAVQNSSNDSKKLALNVTEVIRNWEEQRITGVAVSPPRATTNQDSKKRISDEVPASDSPSKSLPSDRADYLIPEHLKATLVKYLAHLISNLIERYPVPNSKLKEYASVPSHLALPQNDICRKAFTLFYDLLSPGYWSDLDVDLFPRLTEANLASEKTDKALASEGTEKPDEKSITCIVNTLQLVRVILNAKSDEWIQGQITFIQKFLERALRAENPEIQDCLHTSDEKMDSHRQIKPLLRRVLDAIPQDTGDEDDMEVETPSSEFVSSLSTIATETMTAGNLIASFNVLWTFAQVRPAMVDQHIPLIMRALQSKLTKDHVTNAMPPNHPTQNRPGEQTNPPQDPREAEIQTQLILKGVDIMSLRMGALGDQRRPFLGVLASLVDKSFDMRLCQKILSMVETWIFDSSNPWPTLKEKTAVLHKMLNFEARLDPTLLHKFLDLVIRIYENPKITRTELTVRLEHAFLVGTRAHDVSVRNRFLTIFDKSLTRTATSRLLYVVTSQNWDTLAETFWLSQAIQLISGSVEMGTSAQLHSEDFTVIQPSQLFSIEDSRKNSLMLDDKYEETMANHRKFCASLGDVKTRDIMEPLVQLQHTDPDTAYQFWVALFPIFWSALSREERMELEKGMVTLLTKDYHQRQIDRRPNVVQALLEGVVRARPRFKLPPHVMKFLCKTYDAWYTALVSLEESANSPIINTPSVRESNLDALLETYAGLQEDDFFYGAWRRRSKFTETNAALSYEQHGMWDKAQILYDNAQIKARTGVTPFGQAEYMLWEDHWVICSQKLQQWDILSDFARHENFNDLLLEASYRNFESWSSPEKLNDINLTVEAVSDAPTPRRTFFKAFMSLLKFHEKPETLADFNRVCDEAMQLSIRKWHQLPRRITSAHIPILQGFQQLVELHDAQLIFQSLHATTAANLDTKSQELKLLLGSWRDRLPNVWDDINAWQSLVTWRQHIFQQINKTYLGLIQPAGGNNTGSSFAYRGYHETAWIINRFAHVARKHQLPEVCISQLSKIYTLPNIEIQEAFLKLREQAKCHYQNSSELGNGLDVINNTNLNYFAAPQKAEFFTLKGMFLSKLGSREEASDAFGTALYFDIRLPKAWAEWGYYHDCMFKSQPENIEHAAAAVSCYLEAASLFKNAKSRKMLSRVLWLLSIDTAENKVAKAFEDFKGEHPVWYWITFIPQLLTSLSHREAWVSRSILMKIAKLYPQALFFLMRTNREDMVIIKRQAEAKMERMNQQKQSPSTTKVESTEATPSRPTSSSQPNTSNGDTTMTNGTSHANGTNSLPKRDGDGQTQGNTDEENKTEQQQAKKPWEYSEEIMSVLKTAFPLLALSMESMVDQIQKHFKCPPDEDAYRLIVALLNDGIAYVGRVPAAYATDYKLPAATEVNIRKFAETILPPHIRSSFEEEFVAKKPTMYEYIHKLRKWRDKFEEKLDRRPVHASLESFSSHLSEFSFQKFDDVEIPGQYLQHRDKNLDFVKISRFLPNVDLIRTVGFSHRRLKIRGSDGSIHSFAIQHPAARHSRREERTLQLFRIFNDTLSKRKEARRRNLNFYLPLVVPLAPSIRMVQEDSHYVSLQGVYEDHCRRHGLNKDDPVLFTMDRLRAVAEARNNVSCIGVHGKLQTDHGCRNFPTKLNTSGWMRSQLSRRSGSQRPWHWNISRRHIPVSQTSGSSDDSFPTNSPPSAS